MNLYNIKFNEQPYWSAEICLLLWEQLQHKMKGICLTASFSDESNSFEEYEKRLRMGVKLRY